MQVHADMKSGASLVLSFDAGPDDLKDGLLRPAACKAHAMAGQSHLDHVSRHHALIATGCTQSSPAQETRCASVSLRLALCKSAGGLSLQRPGQRPSCACISSSQLLLWSSAAS